MNSLSRFTTVSHDVLEDIILSELGNVVLEHFLRLAKEEKGAAETWRESGPDNHCLNT